MWKSVVLMLAAWSLLGHSACAQTASPAQSPLQRALQAIQSNPEAPLASLSVLAIRDGKVGYEGHFGHRRMNGFTADPRTATDSATLYRIASVSKLVTTMGAMRLVDAGRLDLDSDISQYLGFKVRNPNFPDAPISARMLMSHTSSLRDDAGYVFDLNTRLEDVLSPQGKLYGQGLVWAPRVPAVNQAPGRFFHYVNLNFGVLGTVVEAITQQRFDIYMQHAVLKPLGISGGYLPESLLPDDVQHVAALYRKGQDGAWKSTGPWVAQTDDFQGQVPARRPGLDTYKPGSNATGFGAQGGLRISVAGLGTLLQMLMNQGVVDVAINGSIKPVRLLSPGAVAAMQQPVWRYTPEPVNGDTLDGEFYAWGLGLELFTDTSTKQAQGKTVGDRLVARGGLTGYGHAGFAYGLQSLFFYDPVRRIGLVYALSGTGVDPSLHPGQYSSFYQWEEQIIDAVYTHVLQDKAP